MSGRIKILSAEARQERVWQDEVVRLRSDLRAIRDFVKTAEGMRLTAPDVVTKLSQMAAAALRK